MKILFSNFPQSLTEEDIQKMFSEFGTVQEVIIKRDKKINVSLGYGSIEMKTTESAEQAIQKLNGQELEGKKISLIDSNSVNLQNENDKHAAKNSSGTNSKLFNQRTKGGSGGSVSTPRRSGGGGRGK